MSSLEAHDDFEAALETAQIPSWVREPIREAWIHMPAYAEKLIKEYTRFKATEADPVAGAIERLGQAAHAAGRQRPDAEIIDAINALAEQLGAVPGRSRRRTLGDAEKVTKAARAGGLDTLLDGVSAAAQKGSHRS